MEDNRTAADERAFQRKVHRTWKGERKRHPHGKLPNWALFLILISLLVLFFYMVFTM